MATQPKQPAGSAYERLRKAARCCETFNRDNPLGTLVTVRCDGERRAGRVLSRAYCEERNGAIVAEVRIEGFASPVSLASVEGRR